MKGYCKSECEQKLSNCSDSLFHLLYSEISVRLTTENFCIKQMKQTIVDFPLKLQLVARQLNWPKKQIVFNSKCTASLFGIFRTNTEKQNKVAALFKFHFKSFVLKLFFLCAINFSLI